MNAPHRWRVAESLENDILTRFSTRRYYLPIIIMKTRYAYQVYVFLGLACARALARSRPLGRRYNKCRTHIGRSISCCRPTADQTDTYTYNRPTVFSRIITLGTDKKRSRYAVDDDIYVYTQYIVYTVCGRNQSFNPINRARACVFIVYDDVLFGFCVLSTFVPTYDVDISL